MIALLTATGIGPADAGRCLPHEQAVANLQSHYQERQTGLGLGANGQAVYELFVSENGSWTLLVTRTSGISCVLAAGKDWAPIADDPNGGES